MRNRELKNVNLVRNIPSMENASLQWLMQDVEKTPDNYELKMRELEMKLEKEFGEFLERLGIQASVKEDRYSLQVHEDFYAFNTHELFRTLAKDVIDHEIYKMRYYVFVEVYDFNIYTNVVYCLRYYVHPNRKQTKLKKI